MVMSWRSRPSFTPLVEPASAHVDSLFPASELLSRLFRCNLRLKDCLVLVVDALEVLKCVPQTDGHACSNGRTKSSRFAHGRSVDGDADKVGLCLGL